MILKTLSLLVRLAATVAIIMLFTSAAAVASCFALVGFCFCQVANVASKLLRLL